MKYLLDTNICIYIMKQRPESVLQRFRVMNQNDLGLSIVTVAELEYGVAKSQNPPLNRSRLDNFRRPFQVVGLSDEDVRVFGDIRADLEQRGTPIGAYDLLIAAQAKSRDLVLVTNNMREFERVSGLRLENWVDV
ncbi:MAG: type II toxin-antitoxin system VapC family toxin [Geitlerinemataceae cyanobacterium]